MWPWEHLAVGYVGYSLWCRATGRTADRSGAIAMALGTQFPDLVDKPLGWGTALLPTGTSLAHSALVALPFVAVVVMITHRLGRGADGEAFGVGYLLHLPADALYSLLLGGGIDAKFLLWPLIPAESSAATSVLRVTLNHFTVLPSIVASPVGLRFLVFELALLSAAAGLWLLDGRPGQPADRPRHL